MTKPSLTVDDVAQRLDLVPLAGRSGLTNEVTWAHASELEDPTPWLLGGELIMTTGLAIPRDERGQCDYLERLVAHRMAGLVVSQDLHMPELTPGFIRTAERLGFPVVEAHLAIPFVTIAQEVAAVVLAVNPRRVKSQLDLFGAIRALATDDLTPAMFVQRLERIARCQLYVCGPGRRPLLPGVPIPPPELLASIPLSSDSAPPLLPGGFLVPIPGITGGVGFVVATADARNEPVDLAVTQHIATAIGLQMTGLRYESEMRRREGAELLAELLQGAVDATAARKSLKRVGFDQRQGLRLLHITHAAPLEHTTLVDVVAEAGPAFLTLSRDRDKWALTPDDPAAWAGFEAVPGVRVGVSSAFGWDGSFHVAQKEATWASARAEDLGAPIMVYGEEPLGRWVVEDQNVLADLVQEVLGAVISYDDANSSQLLETVQAWMDANRRVQETAQSLHIHANTVTYRLKRFEELSGRDLSRTSDLTEVWLALRATAHVRSPRQLS